MDKNAKHSQDEAYAGALGCGLDVAAASQNETAAALAQLDCLRHSVEADDYVTKMPEIWNNAGMWNLASPNKYHSDPKGLNLAGLVYVDETLILQSIEKTMSTGNTNSDVALMIGNLGQEEDTFYEWPPHQQYVTNYSVTPQWEEFLADKIFSNWNGGNNGGGGLNASLMAKKTFNFYKSQASAVNPLYADYSILTDYSIGCAAPWLAVKGSQADSKRRAGSSSSSGGSGGGGGGGRVYTFLNNWPPEHPDKGASVWGSYAFHVWDYLCGIQDWGRYSEEYVDPPGVAYKPSTKDLELSRLLRSHWGSMIWNGTLEGSDLGWPEAATGIGEDDDASATSLKTTYHTYQYSREDRFPFKKSGPVKNLIKDECRFFRENGIDERYWWVN